MNYEYNGNLTYEERLFKVSKDIHKSYPNITLEESYLIATLEPPINEVTDEVKFRRLVNILFVKKDEKTIKKVFNEILLLNTNIDIINNGIYLLSKYYSGIGKFPEYSDIFYAN